MTNTEFLSGFTSKSSLHSPLHSGHEIPPYERHEKISATSYPWQVSIEIFFCSFRVSVSVRTFHLKFLNFNLEHPVKFYMNVIIDAERVW